MISSVSLYLDRFVRVFYGFIFILISVGQVQVAFLPGFLLQVEEELLVCAVELGCWCCSRVPLLWNRVRETSMAEWALGPDEDKVKGEECLVAAQE